jgi:hypothetical protein
MPSKRAMASHVTQLVYSGLCDIVGNRLHRPYFDSSDIAEVVGQRRWNDVSKAVYIVLDEQNICAYVGSVDRRTNSGLSSRMTEHSRIGLRGHWKRLMILPLVEGTSEAEVRRFEGEVGRRLRPYDNDKLPN